MHTFHLYWSDESMRYRCSGVFERTLLGLAYGERTVSVSSKLMKESANDRTLGRNQVVHTASK